MSRSQSRTAEREHSIPKEVLDDLISRFVINADDLDDIIRVGFQIEKALWFYEDEYVEGEENVETKALKTCHMRKFMEHVINHCDFLSEYRGDRIDEVYTAWQNYKRCIPTAGAIILNEDMSQVLLCRSYFSKTSWGFPKGKSNEDESMDLCAVREVHEETGFDITPHMDINNHIHRQVAQQSCTLFIVPFIKSDTPFKPIAKKEIGDIQWFPLAHLPSHKSQEIPMPNKLNLRHNGLYMVMPFVKSIKDWVRDYRKGKLKFIPNRSSKTDPRQARRQLSRREAARGRAIEEHAEAAERHRREQEAAATREAGAKSKRAARKKSKGNKENNNPAQAQNQQQQQQEEVSVLEQLQQVLPGLTPGAAVKQEPKEPQEPENPPAPIANSDFKFDMARIIAAMESTPGWIV